MTLRMEAGQLDDYILNFERLAAIAGWDKDAPGTLEFFKRGLPPGLYRACIMREAMPATMNDWQKATRIETQRYKLLQTGPGIKRFGPTQNTGHGYQKKDPNAMEIDATTSVPFRNITKEKRKQYMKKEGGLRFRHKGNMVT